METTTNVPDVPADAIPGGTLVCPICGHLADDHSPSYCWVEGCDEEHHVAWVTPEQYKQLTLW